MKRLLYYLSVALCSAILLQSCREGNASAARLDVILDTDANNELDDQHAIIYLLMNPETFNVLGITTNNTYVGDGILSQTREARRVMDLACKWGEGIALESGAQAGFDDIKGCLDADTYDGSDAVALIIESARKHSPRQKLILIALGKLTNVALAAAKAPEIIPNIRLVWLGGNYPEPGEYNLENDIPSLNYLLDTEMEFEMVTVRYDKPSGTDAVRLTPQFVRDNFAGKGPRTRLPVEGRHGGQFSCFGDYAVSLFENIKLHPDGTRSLYDPCAVAVVKNPSWAHSRQIPAPIMADSRWLERPNNSRKILLWENFDSDAIIRDFMETLEK